MLENRGMSLKNQSERLNQEIDQRKKKIRQWAMELGFQAIGVASAVRNHELAAYLNDRAALGLTNPLEEKSLEPRVNPQAAWNECRSVFVLAYPLPLSAPPQRGQGILARSAVGPDYHSIVLSKLNGLQEKIGAAGWCSQPPRVQVDIGPLNERALAVKAGIGWIGKNQQLIIPRHGSFVSLALLLLDREFPPDVPLPDQCGECQACLQACPVRLLGQKYFDSKRCISYLTQKKGELSEEESRQLGLHIFGCDLCQEVCPHNRQRLQMESDASFQDADFQRGVDLRFLQKISKEQFAEMFRPTAAGWRGRRILKRNAAIGLFNAENSQD